MKRNGDRSNRKAFKRKANLMLLSYELTIGSVYYYVLIEQLMIWFQS